jgi:hypothetical protein
MRRPGAKGALILAAGALVAAGTWATLANLDLPVTRNALTYAKAALGVVEHGFNPIPVARDLEWTSGKPIAFSLLASPLVALFGANTGLILASWIGAVLFLLASVLTVLRLNQSAGVEPRLAPLQVVLVGWGPLVVYQFWSAYPDALLAALVLFGFLLTDTIARQPERDTRAHIVMLGAVIFLALHTKLYGAILGLSCPLYLLMHREALWNRSTHRTSKLALLAGTFLLLALTVLLARAGAYPLLVLATDVEGGGGGLSGYVRGLFEPGRRVVPSLTSLAFALVLHFHFALIFLLVRAARRAWSPAVWMFVTLYLLGLITFEGTSYNMRYFLPAFPFLAVALGAGAGVVSVRTRHRVLVGYALLSTVLVLNFNSARVQEALRPVTDIVFAPSRVDWRLDNLRLEAQVELRHHILVLNERVPAGAVLYWATNYYGRGSHGVAEHQGIDEDITVRYVLTPADVPPHATSVYLTVVNGLGPEGRLYSQPPWAEVRPLGDAVFRLDPITRPDPD